MPSPSGGGGDTQGGGLIIIYARQENVNRVRRNPQNIENFVPSGGAQDEALAG